MADALRRVPAVEGHGIVVRDGDGKCTSAAWRRSSSGTALADARLGDLLHGALTALDAEDLAGRAAPRST